GCTGTVAPALALAAARHRLAQCRPRWHWHSTAVVADHAVPVVGGYVFCPRLAAVLRLASRYAGAGTVYSGLPCQARRSAPGKSYCTVDPLDHHPWQHLLAGASMAGAGAPVPDRFSRQPPFTAPAYAQARPA